MPSLSTNQRSVILPFIDNGKNPYVGTAVHHNMMYAIFLHELAIPYSL